jgi:RNA polymerase sigma factor (sigma-70 family)
MIRAVETLGDWPDLGDRELLRRFAEQNDQAAFAALVHRYSGLVLGVCRRSLGNAQDAEDACQATFLLLARKAADGQWRPSLVNWLYTTARRVAANARRAARRRARREGRAALPEVIHPADQVTGRELLAALDEELDRLAAHYREPLVLCYLEGLTRDEAASRLGVPAGTVKIRLERGRRKLAEALARRGCVLGLGLLALAVTSPAGAAPPRLVEAILTAVAGSPPAAVAALARGVAVNALVNRSVSLLVAVTAVLLGVGAAALKLPAAGEQGPKATANSKTKDVAATTPAKKDVVSGRVLGPEGKPLAGAELLLVGRDARPRKLGVSGADGRFKLRLPGVPRGMVLVARPAGVGTDFIDVGAGAAGEVELRTVKDHAIRGRVIDTQGKPVAGVTVA